MRTERLSPDAKGIARAAELLSRGRLVAFPTETVYGLGALATDGLAVRAIYAAKGRPATNPIIVHVPGAREAAQLALAWPKEAEQLAALHWPGPLTLVVARALTVPDEVTSGGETVGLRAPAHPIAQALLAALKAPLAAPSANASEHVSPTTAEHVLRDLDGRIDAVILGGPCAVGIESTVLSLAHGAPRVLRPGAISRDVLAWELGVGVALGPPPGTATAASPGQHPRHYAPAGKLLMVARGKLEDTLGQLLGTRGAIVHGTPPLNAQEVVRLPPDPAEYGRGLYSALRSLEEKGCVSIAVEEVPQTPAWEAVRDRLVRACS